LTRYATDEGIRAHRGGCPSSVPQASGNDGSSRRLRRGRSHRSQALMRRKTTSMRTSLRLRFHVAQCRWMTG